MSFTELPLQKAFMLLESGPVILVTTRDAKRDNIMTISWHMVLDFTPSFALRTGPWNHSYEALRKHKECVIAVPAVDLAKKAVSIGDCSGVDTDKFSKFRLTPLPASIVNATLIAECLACIECRVTDYVRKHGIFILDGVRAWIDPSKKEQRTFHANGDGTFVTDGRKIDLRRLMEDKVPPGV